MNSMWFRILLLGNVEMMCCEILRVEQIGAVGDGNMHAGSYTGLNPPSGVLSILVRSILILDDVQRTSIGGPHQLAFIFGHDFGALELHCRAGIVGPRVGFLHRYDGMLGEGVFGSQNVNIGFEDQAVIVHRAGKSIMDVVLEVWNWSVCGPVSSRKMQ